MSGQSNLQRDRFLTAASLGIGLVLLFALNILSNDVLRSARLDLTEGRIFTLSEGTRNILASLDEPVTLRFYLSRKLANRVPEIGPFANRVQELLEEYERAAEGKLRLEEIEPEPFSEEEDRAVGYGLRGLPVNTSDEVLYFGLVGTNSVDAEEVIPFFSNEREEFLEYDITKLIHNLATPKLPVIGLVTSLPIEGMGPRAEFRGLTSPAWVVVDQVRQLFDVRSLNASMTSVPDDVDVLMVVHPKGWSDQALYAIDQFVLRGGRALIFVDANAEADQGVQRGGLFIPTRSNRSEFDRLLDAWGVELEKDRVIGDLQLAAKVRMDREGRAVTFDYPVWIHIGPAQMNQEDAVTAKLGNLSIGTPGSLVKKEGADTDFVPLIRTTPGAASFPEDKVAITEDPQNLLRIYAPADRAFTLAARVSGTVKTAFQDGPPPAEEKKDPESKESAATGGSRAETFSGQQAQRPHLSESQQPVNLIIVADTDLLQDQFWVSVQDFLGSRVAVPSAANGAFVVNALDNLTGSGDLISVRNRGSAVRPFERINELREQAELRFRQKEQELIDRLAQTEQKLVELESTRQRDDAMILTPEQQKELLEFRQERLRIRKDLRDVRHRLRQDIENLESSLKVINIGLVPLLIAVSGVLVAVYRIRRRRRALSSAT
ncbi:MAG: Gldg family protein [Gammaproteobacteria bacterium]|nr:Gldg family protein [Gammaproteobacteria bacterium]